VGRGDDHDPINVIEKIELGAHERKNNTHLVKLGSLSSKTVGTCVFTLTAAKALIRRGVRSAMQGPEEEGVASVTT